MTRFLLVRHGQTDWNIEERIQGHTDIPLNTTGLQQAEKIAERLRHESIAHIYSSHLSRARATAEAIARHHANVPFTVKEELAEFMMGVLEGMRVSDAHLQYGTTFWDDDIEREHLKMHTKQSYHERFRTLIPQWCELHPNETIVLATHGGTKQAILRAFDLSDVDRKTISEKWCGNCSLSIVEVDSQGKGSLALYACTKHLDE